MWRKRIILTPSLLLTLDIVMDFCKKNDTKGFGDYDFDLENVTLVYAHELPSNDLDMITQIANLSNSGIIAPEIALQHVSWIENPHEYMKNAKKWQEQVDKRKQEVKNSSMVANDTNIERQNQNPVKPDQFDNKQNGALGAGNRISDNKVE